MYFQIILQTPIIYLETNVNFINIKFIFNYRTDCSRFATVLYKCIKMSLLIIGFLKYITEKILGFNDDFASKIRSILENILKLLMGRKYIYTENIFLIFRKPE